MAVSKPAVNVDSLLTLFLCVVFHKKFIKTSCEYNLQIKSLVSVIFE